MATMYPSKLLSDVDWGYPDVTWHGSIAKNGTKTIATTKRPRAIAHINVRSDNQYRNMTIWNEKKQRGIRGYYTSTSGDDYNTPLNSSNLSSDGFITSLTDSGFTVKNGSSSYTYYFSVLAWY